MASSIVTSRAFLLIQQFYVAREERSAQGMYDTLVALNEVDHEAALLMREIYREWKRSQPTASEDARYQERYQKLLDACEAGHREKAAGHLSVVWQQFPRKHSHCEELFRCYFPKK